MKIYEVKVSWSSFGSDCWLIQAESLLKAVEKATKKIKRAPRRYENYEVVRASLVGELVR
jgi:hypothetical protein